MGTFQKQTWSNAGSNQTGRHILLKKTKQSGRDMYVYYLLITWSYMSCQKGTILMYLHSCTFVRGRWSDGQLVIIG